MKETRGTCGDLFGVLFGSPTHLLILSFFSLSFFFRCCRAEHSCGWHLKYFLVYLGRHGKEAWPSSLCRRSLFPGVNEILNPSENSELLCPKFNSLELEKVVLSQVTRLLFCASTVSLIYPEGGRKTTVLTQMWRYGQNRWTETYRKEFKSFWT